MTQVPTFLIIGNGRLSKHFQHYFNLLQLSFQLWNRDKTIEELEKLIPLATHILVLISDDAIDPFCEKYLKSSTATLVHCSGSLWSQYAHSAHPLMTFGATLYTLSDYQAIPFAIETLELSTLIPGIPNTFIRLTSEQKAKYHALCVMSGNFSCLLWQKLFGFFEEELKVPSELAYPYLRQQTKNLLVDNKNALTGPLMRNDINTIQNNLNALDGDPFQTIYQSFVQCFQQLKQEDSCEHS